MEPIIYKPGAYNTLGVYKGAGGIYKGNGIYNDGSLPENYVILNGRIYENKFSLASDGIHFTSTFKDAISLPVGYEKLDYVHPSSISAASNWPALIETDYQLPENFGSIFVSWKVNSIARSYATIAATKYVDEDHNITRLIMSSSVLSLRNNTLNIRAKTGSGSTSIQNMQGLEIRDDRKYRSLSDSTYFTASSNQGTAQTDYTWCMLSPSVDANIYFCFIVDSDKQVTFTAIPCKHGSDYGIYDLVGNKFYTHSALTGVGGEYVEIGDRTYNVEKIGSLKWTTENLELKCVAIGGDLYTTTPNAWYYNNDSSYGNKYGLLYNYNALSVITSNLTDGWRIPSNNDLDSLMAAAGGAAYGGEKLKSKEWNGTDDFKFNMLPGGMAWGSFMVFGQYGYLWSTNKYRWNFKPSADVTYENITNDYAAFSVRLCKDA